MAFSMMVAGDLAPTESNEHFFVAGDAEHLFGTPLLNVLDQADFRCYNLELPLTTQRNPRKHPGPKMMANPEILNTIKKLKPSLLTLGNNHMLDQGCDGCISTMLHLKAAGIPFVGAGDRLSSAKEPFYFQADGLTIGIYNCEEHEFAAATETTCGANYYDPLVTFDDIREMRPRCDKLIVLFHGGKERYRYPTPMAQRVSRKLVDCGADIVIWQHSHCIGCEESYKGANIVYGLGNMLFDRPPQEFRTGLIANIVLEDGKQRISYIPVVLHKEVLRMAKPEEAQKLLDGFNKRSEQIKDPAFVRENYEALADRQWMTYIKKIFKNRLIFRAINRLLGERFYNKMFDKVHSLRVLNLVSTPYHLELLQTALRNRSK